MFYPREIDSSKLSCVTIHYQEHSGVVVLLESWIELVSRFEDQD